MNLVLPTLMTVDEFLRWSERQECGRYELEGGRVIAMPSETFGHVKIKTRVHAAIAAAIARAGLQYYAIPDGMSVRIDDRRWYEPDTIVGPLPEPPESSLYVADPIIVVAVLSPTTMRRDLTTKVTGYASVPTISHYVVVDRFEREVLHYRRQDASLVLLEQVSEGVLKLDPPGLEVLIADMLGPPPEVPAEA